jgi:nucleoid-associated protein YgaU
MWRYPMSKTSLLLIVVLSVSVVVAIGGCKNPFRKDEPALAGPVGAKATRDPVPEPVQYSGTLPTMHTVKKGDTLWALANFYHGSGKSWQRIAEANGIHGTHIPVGAQLTIPR